MIRSYNEIVGMALKAARGAGVPLGHAEEFSRAVGALALSNPMELHCVIVALRTTLDDMTITNAGTLSIAPAPVILAAPMALDALRSGDQSVTLENIDAVPLLNAYLIAAHADLGLTVRLSGDGTTIAASQEPWPDYQPGPVDVADAVWDDLMALAALTYVPASEASRIAGAGAGLSDND